MKDRSNYTFSSALGGLSFAVGLFVFYNFMYSVTVPKYRYIEPNF